MRGFCELVTTSLDEWSDAMAVAPAVSVPYWKALVQRYAHRCISRDGHVYAAAPHLIATGDLALLSTLAITQSNNNDNDNKDGYGGHGSVPLRAASLLLPLCSEAVGAMPRTGGIGSDVDPRSVRNSDGDDDEDGQNDARATTPRGNGRATATTTTVATPRGGGVHGGKKGNRRECNEKHIVPNHVRLLHYSVLPLSVFSALRACKSHDRLQLTHYT
jgi:hypothetical protein